MNPRTKEKFGSQIWIWQPKVILAGVSQLKNAIGH
jgi:hypothetical protein